MLVQPYVENAIKHGLLHKKENKLLYVSFLKDNNTLIIHIDDNGIGRKKSAEFNAHKRHQSFAMNANIKRIEILKKSASIPIAFEIIDKENTDKISLGTTVIIKLPLKAVYT
jgi:LytS/YehU family sensor histidine kinase